MIIKHVLSIILTFIQKLNTYRWKLVFFSKVGYESVFFFRRSDPDMFLFSKAGPEPGKTHPSANNLSIQILASNNFVFVFLARCWGNGKRLEPWSRLPDPLITVVKGINSNKFAHGMSKTYWPSLYSDLLNKNGQDFMMLL